MVLGAPEDLWARLHSGFFDLLFRSVSLCRSVSMPGRSDPFGKKERRLESPGGRGLSRGKPRALQEGPCRDAGKACWKSPFPASERGSGTSHCPSNPKNRMSFHKELRRTSAVFLVLLTAKTLIVQPSGSPLTGDPKRFLSMPQRGIYGRRPCFQRPPCERKGLRPERHSRVTVARTGSKT